MKTLIQNNKHNNLISTPSSSEKYPEELDWWMKEYFENEVHTSSETRKAQIRDISIFLDYMFLHNKTLNRNHWTLKVTRNFIDWLRTHTDSRGNILRNDRTINRIMAHLKTFAKWMNEVHPFSLFNPMLKIRISESGKYLDIGKAISPSERVRILESADNLIAFDALSKDKFRYKDKEKPVLKYKRPFRDRAIIYTLIETGMRRCDILNIKIDRINFKTRKIYLKNKKTHKYIISKQGLKAIRDYIKKERNIDFEKWKSNVLFLSPSTVSRGDGQLTACVINNIWNKVCKAAGISGKTPHSSRHAMGKYIIKKTGNPAAVQKQLGHKNPAYSHQYARVTEKEINDILHDR
jgi:integrase